MPHGKLLSWPKRLYHFRDPGREALPPDLHSRTLRVPQGRVFVGDGEELGDSSKPPLVAALCGLVA
jgi:hypothetical protein